MPRRSVVGLSAMLIAALGAALWLAGGSARSGSTDPPAAPRPDVELLLVDTLRADHTSLYGYPRATTPNLDRFARGGRTYGEVVAASSWTLPSVASIFTSQYPSVHGLRAHRGDAAVTALRPGMSTLAERFRRAGYRTVAVVTNPWLRAHPDALAGFDEVSYGSWRHAAWVHKVAAEALARRDRRPVFLYLHYLDVHGPYRTRAEAGDPLVTPPGAHRLLTARELAALPRYLAMPRYAALEDYVDAYDRGIRRWDRQFGSWIEWLRRQGREAKTIIAIVSDHGEELLDHGGWNHGDTLYQEQIRVPLVLRGPGVSRLGRRSGPVSTLDLAPTLLALARIPVPPEMSGRSLVGDAAGPIPTIYAETAADQDDGGRFDPAHALSAAIRWPWKLVVGPGVECFDLRWDPGERSPLSAAEACESTLTGDLSRWQTESARRAAELGDGRAAPADPAAERDLRSLGYLH